MRNRILCRESQIRCLESASVLWEGKSGSAVGKEGKGKKISSQSGEKAGSTSEVIYGRKAVDERPLLFAPKKII